MDILNNLEIESSSDSDDDDYIEYGHSSGNESDAVTMSSTQTMCVESDSSTHSGSSTVSLLNVLKAPDMLELSCKRRIMRNPPTGKRKANSNSQINPKLIKPQQRVNEYSTEPFIVASGKLFCQSCREELPLKKVASTITSSQVSTWHSVSKNKLEQKKVKDQDIAQSLRKYNDEIHARGETLQEYQQIFRVKVVKTFLLASVSLSKAVDFRELLEETGYPSYRQETFVSFNSIYFGGGKAAHQTVNSGKISECYF